MKIEVCELLISSWLKHIKRCQVVQMNWTPSPLDKIDETDLLDINLFINDVKAFMSDTEIDIFKKSTVKQFIRQCEIDVVGIKVLDGNVDELYFVDSAFHEAGLGYKNPISTIIKKILRAVIIADLFFKRIPAQIVFVSPFANESVSFPIQMHLDKLDGLVKAYYPDIKISMIFNEKFTREIYLPLTEKLEMLNNDNDLFLRNMKLVNLCEKFLKKDANLPEFAGKTTLAINKEKTKHGDNEKKIFGILNCLISHNLMTDEMISNLKNEDYTNTHFHIPTFPLLITKDNFTKKGYQRSRFYKNTIFINETHYLVCSQWIPDRIRQLEIWIDKVMTI